MKGRLEGGQLYTPAYVARVNSMVRGAARAITVPTNLSVLWGTIHQLLQDMDGASGVVMESSFFQSLFNGLVKEGKVLGSLRAGVHWTPNVCYLILNNMYTLWYALPCQNEKSLTSYCLSCELLSLLCCTGKSCNICESYIMLNNILFLVYIIT